MERSLKPGRPIGSRTFEPEAGRAFGAVIRKYRTDMGISQEELGLLAQIERSHMGKIERGQHLPNLALILRLASALKTSPGGLVDLAAAQLAGGGEGPPSRQG
jgi:transcriptional regulator with XRE-family HTH domain